MLFRIEQDELVGCHDVDQHVIIPDGVKMIASHAFRGCHDLRDVIIPKSVKRIESAAFLDCPALNTVSFENIVRVKGQKAFRFLGDEYEYDVELGYECDYEDEEFTVVDEGLFVDCPQLCWIEVGQCRYPLEQLEPCDIFEWAAREAMNEMGDFDFVDDVVTGFSPDLYQTVMVVPLWAQGIADEAFCLDQATWDDGHDMWDNGRDYDYWDGWFLRDDLRCVVLPDGLEFIGKRAFYGCESLRRIVLPESLREIGEAAFSDCEALQTIALPAGLSRIGRHAFYSCGLTRIEVPPQVSTLECCTFAFCENLVDVTLSEGLVEIGEEAFYYCSRLASIKIPKSVRRICKGAFLECRELASMELSEGLQFIEEEALGFTSLKRLRVPASLEYITTWAFHGYRWGSRFPSEIVVDEENPCYDSRCGCNAIIETRKNRLSVGCQGSKIPPTVTSIGGHAFLNVRGLTELTIPDSVTHIESNAFHGCDLKRVIVGRGVVQLGSEAFIECVRLEQVVLPESLTDIGRRCFEDCRSLRSIHIPDSVTTIRSYAFLNCTSLEGVFIGKGVETIEKGAFSHCPALKSIKVHQENRHFTSAIIDEDGEPLKSWYSADSLVTELGHLFGQ